MTDPINKATPSPFKQAIKQQNHYRGTVCIMQVTSDSYCTDLIITSQPFLFVEHGLHPSLFNKCDCSPKLLTPVCGQSRDRLELSGKLF